ncbi:MAG TPA: Sec-independent protein translocase subunit TatA [Cellulomonas sp.]
MGRLFEHPATLLVLIIIVLLLFGAKRLPDLASGIGQSLRIFKREVTALQDDDKQDPAAQTPPAAPTVQAPVAPVVQTVPAPVAAPAPAAPTAPVAAPAPVVPAPAPAPAEQTVPTAPVHPEHRPSDPPA